MTLNYREFRKIVGERIHQARLKKNISRMRLGAAAGLEISDILVIENGYRIPTVKILIMLCGELGINVEDLFRGLPIPVLTPEQKGL